MRALFLIQRRSENGVQLLMYTNLSCISWVVEALVGRGRRNSRCTCKFSASFIRRRDEQRGRANKASRQSAPSRDDLWLELALIPLIALLTIFMLIFNYLSLFRNIVMIFAVRLKIKTFCNYHNTYAVL